VLVSDKVISSLSKSNQRTSSWRYHSSLRSIPIENKMVSSSLETGLMVLAVEML
jgi:hypothetical protein